MSLFSSVEIRLIGAKDLQLGYRSATNSISSEIEFTKVLTLPDQSSVDQAYIGFIKAKEIVRIASIGGETGKLATVNRSVFYDNVRDFNPESEINRSIIKELQAGQADSFIFKNNGITVVARDIRRVGDTFSLEDYQIVNGCQTTNILFLARDYIENVFVPLRIIGSKDVEFISSIIIGTNKQNEVKEEQFWALMPFMKDLEEYCRSQEGETQIFIERRENQYRDTPSERTRIFKPAELMKSIAAMYLYQPNRAARDSRGIRREFSGQIFQTGHNVELYHLAALASYKFDFVIRNRLDRSRGIYKYYVLFALVRQFWSNANLLDAPVKKQSAVRDSVRGIILDEERFITFIIDVSSVLDDIISSAGAVTREAIRDSIRTDAALEAFLHRFFGVEPGVRPVRPE